MTRRSNLVSLIAISAILLLATTDWNSPTNDTQVSLSVTLPVSYPALARHATLIIDCGALKYQ